MFTRLRLASLALVASLAFLETILIYPKPLLTPIARKEQVLRSEVREWMNQNTQTLAPGIPRGDIPNAWASGTTYSRSRNGRRSYSIRSNEINLYTDINLIHARTTTISIYDAQGIKAVIDADECKIETKSDLLSLYGSIEARFRDGLIVRTSEMSFNSHQDLLTIPLAIEVEGSKSNGPEDPFTFVSKGLTFSTRDEVCHLHHDVEVVISPTHGEQVVVNSDTAIWDTKQLIYKFYANHKTRHVKIWNGGLYIQGDEAQWLSNQTTLGKNHFLVIGHTLSQESVNGVPFRRSTSNKINYYQELDRILLTGYPVVQENNETLIGEEIWIHRRENTVKANLVNALSKGKN